MDNKKTEKANPMPKNLSRLLAEIRKPRCQGTLDASNQTNYLRSIKNTDETSSNIMRRSTDLKLRQTDAELSTGNVLQTYSDTS